MMQASLKKCLRVIDSISDLTGKAVSFLMFSLALVVGYEVVARYVFGRPTLWVHELSAMFFGTFVIVGGAYTLRKGGHVNMDVVYGTFPPRVRAFLDIVTSFVAFAFVVVLLWKGGEAAWRSVKLLEHASTQWGPPLYPFRVMLPLGALLLLLQLLAKFARDLHILIKGKDEA